MSLLTLLRFHHTIRLSRVVVYILFPEILLDSPAPVRLQLTQWPCKGGNINNFCLLGIMPIYKILLTHLLFAKFMLKLSFFITFLNLLYELKMILPKSLNDLTEFMIIFSSSGLSLDMM